LFVKLYIFFNSQIIISFFLKTTFNYLCQLYKQKAYQTEIVNGKLLMINGSNSSKQSSIVNR